MDKKKKALLTSAALISSGFIMAGCGQSTDQTSSQAPANKLAAAQAATASASPCEANCNASHDETCSANPGVQENCHPCSATPQNSAPAANPDASPNCNPCTANSPAESQDSTSSPCSPKNGATSPSCAPCKPCKPCGAASEPEDLSTSTSPEG